MFLYTIAINSCEILMAFWKIPTLMSDMVILEWSCRTCMSGGGHPCPTSKVSVSPSTDSHTRVFVWFFVTFPFYYCGNCLWAGKSHTLTWQFQYCFLFIIWINNYFKTPSLSDTGVRCMDLVQVSSVIRATACLIVCTRRWSMCAEQEIRVQNSMALVRQKFKIRKKKLIVYDWGLLCNMHRPVQCSVR